MSTRPVLLPKEHRGLPKAVQEMLSRCRYFTGTHNDCCERGVCYHVVEQRNIKQDCGWYVHPFPCLNRNLDTCNQRKYYTVEEALERHETYQQGWARAIKALVAIESHIRKTGLDSGVIRCPNCESGTLKYTRGKKLRGLIAGCTTQGCTKIMS